MLREPQEGAPCAKEVASGRDLSGKGFVILKDPRADWGVGVSCVRAGAQVRRGNQEPSWTQPGRSW